MQTERKKHGEERVTRCADESWPGIGCFYVLSVGYVPMWKFFLYVRKENALLFIKYENENFNEE